MMFREKEEDSVIEEYSTIILFFNYANQIVQITSFYLQNISCGLIHIIAYNATNY